jgi:hypothetical protein
MIGVININKKQIVCKGKCEFLSFHVEYLGFILFKEDLFANPKKIQLVVDWFIPDWTDLKGSYDLWAFIYCLDENIF